MEIREYVESESPNSKLMLFIVFDDNKSPSRSPSVDLRNGQEVLQSTMGQCRRRTEEVPSQ